MDNANICFRGHIDHGDKIIKALEDLGGININGKCGDDSAVFYYLKNGLICASLYVPNGYIKYDIKTYGKDKICGLEKMLALSEQYYPELSQIITKELNSLKN